MKAIEGIIFDMDGVLWDSIKTHEQAFLDTLSTSNFHFKFNYYDYTGMTTKEVFKKFLSKHSVTYDDLIIEKLVKQKQQIAFDLLSSKPPFKEGIPNVLLRLSNLFSLGIATSGSFRSCELFLEKSQTRSCFKSILSGENFKGKPSPDIYLKSIEKMEISPSKLLVVEDAINGIEAAQRAGLMVVAMKGTHSTEELRKTGATHIISSLSELEELHDL